jgi:sugar phosphate isomerase/epimerase
MLKLSVFPKGFYDALLAQKMSVWKWFELAATLKVEGVELFPEMFQSFDLPLLRKMRKTATDHGFVLPMFCCSPDFTQPDPAARSAEVARMRHMIDVTAELGGSFCRVLSGQNRPGLDEAEALKWVIDCIQSLVPHAEATGIVLTIENHYKAGIWQYPEWAQSHARYLAILRGVPSPWLKAQYDPSNAIVAGEDQYQLLDDVLPRLATMQASDRYLEGGTIDDLKKQDKDPQHGYARYIKHGVIGRGLNDYDRIFSTLSRANYRGWISVEDGEGDTVEQGLANLQASVDFLRGKVTQYYGKSPT